MILLEPGLYLRVLQNPLRAHPVAVLEAERHDRRYRLPVAAVAAWSASMAARQWYALHDQMTVARAAAQSL